jgi:dihydropteroate synthase
LRLRALGESPGAFSTSLAEALALPATAWTALGEPRPDRALFLAERDGAPVGMARVERGTEPDHRADPARAELFSMWVAPEARGAGVARALVAAAIAWARRRAALELGLDVVEANAPARALYASCGFVDVGPADGPPPCRRMVRRFPPLILGVVNVTPDSFSDGGRFLEPAAAVAQGLALRSDGADLLDVGGEATGPRAAPVGADLELRRVLPVIAELVAAGATVSVDTTKAVVARAAVAAGAAIVNDVSGGAFDPAMLATAGELDATYIAGHLRGATLAEVYAAEGAPPWRAVCDELAARVAALPPAARARAWVDPGLGFGKGASPDGNLALLRRCTELRLATGCPVVVGPSRKRFLRRALEEDRGGAGPPGGDERALDAATIGACLAAASAGAQVLRVHNVALLRPALAVYTRA